MAWGWASTSVRVARTNHAAHEKEPRPEGEPRGAFGFRGCQAWVVVAVAAGGVVGTLLRYEVALAFPASHGSFPAATLLTNISGSLLLGALYAATADGSRRFSRYVRPFFGIGVLGAYTTWSTFVVGTDRLFADGRPVAAALYLLVSLVAGILAAALGIRAGRRVSRHRPVRSAPW